ALEPHAGGRPADLVGGDDALGRRDHDARGLRQERVVLALLEQERAGLVGEVGVEDRHVGPDRRHEHDPPVGVERIRDDAEVGPEPLVVRADVARDRQEGYPRGSRLEPREEPGSGVVEAGEPPRLGVAAEVRREAVLVEDDLGELDGGGGPGADQQVQTEAAGRGGDQPEVARAALDDLADERARGREERSAADAHLHPAPYETGDVGKLDPLVPHAVIVSGAGARGPRMWDAWWWIMRHRSPSRSNKL